jgi:hypothetical protein
MSFFAVRFPAAVRLTVCREQFGKRAAGAGSRPPRLLRSHSDGAPRRRVRLTGGEAGK